MLKRFHADNFRCLVNFDFKPQQVTLLVGRNGSGKSTVVDAIKAVRDLLSGAEVNTLYPFTRTYWESRSRQRFEVDVDVGVDGEYTYVLEIDQTEQNRPRLLTEEVTRRGLPLFRFTGGQVQLFTDSHSPRGDAFGYETSTSALASFATQGSQLGKFRSAMTQMLFFSIDPKRMDWKSDSEAKVLSQDGANLVSFLRSFSQEEPRAFGELAASLKRVVTAFDHLRFKDVGESKWMQVLFAPQGGTSFTAPLTRLSDGERCILALYTILHAYRGRTIFLDEPENFVALDEIRPWLYLLRESVDDYGGQVIVASHHPDVVDYLAVDDALLLSRPGGDVARLARFEVDGTVDESASEGLRETFLRETS
jgi:predicted ATPase